MELLAEAPEGIRSLIGGKWQEIRETEPDIDPYRGTVVAYAPRSTAADCDQAVAAASAAREAMAAMPPAERARYLRRVADRVQERAEEIGLAMARESGKALNDARREAYRSCDILHLCAEEAVRIEGSHIPLDASATGSGKIAMTLRFPVGVVAAITPFNAPVSVTMHKLGPAFAAGNTVVLKGSPKAPLSMHKVVECFIEAGGLPDGALNTLYGDAIGPRMIGDPRVDFISFTGSTRVGKLIRAGAGMKRVALELGGVGPTVIHSDADVDAAAIACARNAMLVAGQSCISVQNAFVHRTVLEKFTARLLEEVHRLRVGDPLDPATDIGTLIDEESAIRVAGMVDRGVEGGAEVLTGSNRDGASYQPTVLFNVTREMEVVKDEIFGPVMSILPYSDIDDVLSYISNSPYGLQCGIFTGSIAIALKTIQGVRTGGVIVNGPSRWRSDQMPYGGIKDSGIGREGPKYSILDMTDERFFVFN